MERFLSSECLDHGSVLKIVFIVLGKIGGVTGKIKGKCSYRYHP
jgi:hypothetical protein